MGYVRQEQMGRLLGLRLQNASRATHTLPQARGHAKVAGMRTCPGGAPSQNKGGPEDARAWRSLSADAYGECAHAALVPHSGQGHGHAACQRLALRRPQPSARLFLVARQRLIALPDALGRLLRAL